MHHADRNSERATISAVTTIADGSKSLPLLFLGQNTDPHSERGVECPGALPPASDPDLVERALKAKAALGDQVFVLGHHYQRDEVIQFADVTGDSFKLARDAAAEGQQRKVNGRHVSILFSGDSGQSSAPW